MKNYFRFLVFSSFFLILFSAKSVHAQEEAVTAKTDVVYQTQSLVKDIRQLTLQYRSELEEYRRLEREFQIALKQYEQLATLASLEEAVRSTQVAQQSRDRVLHTYLRLLRLKLLSQTGIEVAHKKSTEEELLATLQKIEQHQEGFKDNLDRVMLDQLADDFAVIAPQIEDVIYRVFSLIAVGELETVYDQSILLKEDMYAQLATTSGALKNTQRQRSFEETDRTIEELKTSFNQLRAKVVVIEGKKFKSIYSSINDELFKSHASLSRILAYLEELLTS